MVNSGRKMAPESQRLSSCWQGYMMWSKVKYSSMASISREYDYEKYVSRFSVVFQDSQLFSMSVYENITFSGPLRKTGPVLKMRWKKRE